MPTQDDQVFAIYLRAPKITDRTVTYRVELIVADSDAEEFEFQSPAAFQWTVLRNEQGQSRIEAIPPGQSFTMTKAVSKAHAVETEDTNGNIERHFEVHMEEIEIELDVPEDFKFTVDKQGNRHNVFNVVRVLN